MAWELERLILEHGRGKESCCWLGPGYVGLPQGSMVPFAAKHKVENQTKSAITLWHAKGLGISSKLLRAMDYGGKGAQELHPGSQAPSSTVWPYPFLKSIQACGES